MKIKGSNHYLRASDNRWIGVVELERDDGGTRNRKTVSAKTEKEVRKKLNKLIYEIENDEYTKPIKDSLLEFLKEYHHICAGFDMWDENAVRPKKAKWEETTASLYKMYIDVHFQPYFKSMKLTDIKPMTLDKFYNYKLSNIENKKIPMSINTVRKLNTFLKSAFNYAVKNNLLPKNPTNNVVLGKKEQYKPNVYNEDQFTKLLDNVTGTDDEIPILLGGGCGLRRGEVFGLEWKDIDFKKKTITISQTSVRFDKHVEKSPKTESSKRTIKVPEYVLTVLNNYKKKDKIIPKSDSKVITRWLAPSYSERFKNLLQEFGMEHIRFHDLRHYNAVIMMKYGVSDKVAAERLGHSDVATLRNVYQHVLEDMDEKAASEINEMFRKTM